MISRYEQEHGVNLDQVGRCAANTGQVDKFLNDLHSALTENRPIPNLEGYGLRLYETSKRHPLVRSTAEAYAQAWGELMFADEDQVAKLTRDPVAPARRSDAAMKKVLSRTLEDGSPTHSYSSKVLRNGN